ncbi:MAG: HesA/MoeB/ThiF family protein [Euryarchaeota archaeon]|nr:HesA/MoeB/ThiF family protein [Euryarchaeota archaeon]MBV1729351.1 HesA/MoeB/ThiF family protein [Methanobacterium sp.]MBU4547612.1 HesA/MoeB/ThiF family protein [Euryarchaeota archaeon]MBU4606923.1 HesA/MoeB/ThiF family protein [Euryarchaeota archaeon]MBV1754987.1 HesA/MoeB/ThiF family protein [Methanobacterium sp.]
MPKRYEGMAYWEIVSRQMGILTKNQQMRLKDSKITVIGCGGIGGAVLEMLARMGVGSLRIIDKDTFDVSNINRQLMSSFYTVGQSKTSVTQDIIRSINPFVKVKLFEEELDSDNVEKIIKGSTLVIDALDNLISRIIVSRCALKFDIPFIHGAIHGTMGQVSVFNRDTPPYEELFQLPSLGGELTGEVIEKLKEMGSEVPPVIAPVPNIVGCLQAFEAVKLITMEGEPIMAPDVLMFDLLGKDPFSIVKF